MRLALIISGLVVVGAVIYYFVTRQTSLTAAAVAGTKPGDIDPLTGQRWQTVADAQAHADGSSATQTSTALVH